MPCKHTFYNQGMIEELEEETTLLQALLSCATGVWYSTEDDEDTEDALIIPEATDIKSAGTC